MGLPRSSSLPPTRRGEVLNIGVVLLAPATGFFGARFVDSWSDRALPGS